MSDIISTQHIHNLIESDRIVVRYYNGKKLKEKVEFSPKDLDEYLQHFIDSGALSAKSINNNNI